MRVFFSDRYIVETGSPVPLEKLRLVSRDVRVDVREPEPASYQDLERVHDRAYIEAVRTGRPIELAESQGFVWSPQLFDAVSYTSGGMIEAGYAALEDGISGNLACGFHHARRERGEGYCTFNGLAVAIKRLKSEGLGKALVVDGDVHFGNGTARIFLDDPDVFTFSVYGIGADPVKETETNRRIQVKGRQGYKKAMGEVSGIMDRHRPEIILYQASVDAYCGDPFSNLGLTEKDLRDRDRFIFGQARDRGIPIAFVLGGGYGKEGYKLIKVAQLHTNTVLEASSASKEVV